PVEAALPPLSSVLGRGKENYAWPPSILTYFLANLVVARTPPRSCRLRLPLLWLFRCFLPACVRRSLPLADTRKRLREALCDFCLGMGPLFVKREYHRDPARGRQRRGRKKVAGERGALAP